jgi:hypothetical protein
VVFRKQQVLGSNPSVGSTQDADPRQKPLAAYGPGKLERLMAVKRRYDPDNLFRVNHNIPSAATG